MATGSHTDMKFREEFGQITDAGEESDVDHDPGDGKHCQAFLCPGVCKSSLTTEYFVLFEQVKNLLRMSRSERRNEGYLPHHVLLLFTKPEFLEQHGSDLSAVEQVHLLSRVSFSPFDGTAIEFKMSDFNNARAKAVDSEEFGLMVRPLPLLLQQVAAKHPSSTPLWVSTCKYKAISLNEIELDQSGLVPAIQYGATAKAAADDGGGNQPSDHSGQEDNGDSDMLISNSRSMLKAALGGMSKKRSRAVSKSDQYRMLKRRVQKDTKRCKTTEDAVWRIAKGDDNGNAGDGRADIASETITQEWANAIEAQLGPLPAAAGSTSTSSISKPQGPKSKNGKQETQQTSAASSSSGTAIPIVSTERPWRDSNGYCWCFNEATRKPYPLGSLDRKQLHICVCVSLWLWCIGMFCSKSEDG